MAKERFTIAQLQSLDNSKIAALFQRAVRDATSDCVDRPNEKAARKVLLTIEITPDPSDDVCSEVMMGFHVDLRVPKQSTKKYQMEVRKNGDILVNEASPDAIRQGTLDETR